MIWFTHAKLALLSLQVRARAVVLSYTLAHPTRMVLKFILVHETCGPRLDEWITQYCSGSPLPPGSPETNGTHLQVRLALQLWYSLVSLAHTTPLELVFYLDRILPNGPHPILGSPSMVHTIFDGLLQTMELARYMAHVPSFGPRLTSGSFMCHWYSTDL